MRTVYSAFGRKREILSRICERGWRQAQARERAAEVLAEPDPERRLGGAASWLTSLYCGRLRRGDDLRGSHRREPRDPRSCCESKLAGRNEVMDAMIASLDGHLRAPLREAQAVYRALAAPGVYRELVEESGWTPDEYERWVGDALERYAAGGR